MEMKNLCYMQSVLGGGAPVISKACSDAGPEIGLCLDLTDCRCHGIAQPLAPSFDEALAMLLDGRIHRLPR